MFYCTLAYNYRFQLGEVSESFARCFLCYFLPLCLDFLLGFRGGCVVVLYLEAGELGLIRVGGHPPPRATRDLPDSWHLFYCFVSLLYSFRIMFNKRDILCDFHRCLPPSFYPFGTTQCYQSILHAYTLIYDQNNLGYDSSTSHLQT